MVLPGEFGDIVVQRFVMPTCHLTYAAAGIGPPLIKAANWLSHLEFDVGSPVWSHLLIDASIHAGDQRRARHYIAERQTHKPTAWSERLFARSGRAGHRRLATDAYQHAA